MSEDSKNTPIQSLAFCVKSKDWTVQWQSFECRAICGEKFGTICAENCRAWSHQENKNDELGANTFKFKDIHGARFDVVVLNTEDEIVSVLCPMSEKHKQLLNDYNSRGLTNREIEIHLLRTEGLTHKEIRKRLFISESTLKTHIQNIKFKLSDFDETK